MPEYGPLTGLRVLVTRPAHQAQGLCALIEQAGGRALCFPTIEIVPPQDTIAFDATLERLDQFDIAVFISLNAVERTMQTLAAHGKSLPAGLVVACLGSGSARALEKFDIATVITPTRTDSEGLLGLEPFKQVQGKRIVIFRGEGGREVLAQSLRARGAQVEYAECYRRQRPQTDAGPLVAALEGGKLDVITVTSTEAFLNLCDMLSESGVQQLATMPIIVVSERLRAVCVERGMQGPVRVTQTVADKAIVDAIEAWRAAQKPL